MNINYKNQYLGYKNIYLYYKKSILLNRQNGGKNNNKTKNNNKIKNNNKKIVVFDFDYTLSKYDLSTEVAMNIGIMDDMDFTIRNVLKFRDYLSPLFRNKEFINFLKKTKSDNVKYYIVSYGLHDMIDYVIKENNFDDIFTDIYTSKIFDLEENHEFVDLLDGKNRFFKKIMREENMTDKKNILFFDDNPKNYEKAILGGYNAVKVNPNTGLTMKNFKDIKEFLGKN